MRGAVWADVDTWTPWAVTAIEIIVRVDSDEVGTAAAVGAPAAVTVGFGWLSIVDVRVGSAASAAAVVSAVTAELELDGICSDSDTEAVAAAEVVAVVVPGGTCSDADPGGVVAAGVSVESVCGSESVAAGPTTGPAAVAEPGTEALFTALVTGAVGVPGST